MKRRLQRRVPQRRHRLLTKPRQRRVLKMKRRLQRRVPQRRHRLLTKPRQRRVHQRRHQEKSQ